MKVTLINHRGKEWIAIQTKIKDKRIFEIKKIPGRKWSQTKKSWLLPITDSNKDFVRSLSNTIKSEGILTSQVNQKNIKEEPIIKKIVNQKQNKPLKPKEKNKIQQTVLILKGNQMRISFFPGKEGLKYIKSLSLKRYNPETKQWTIPYTDENVNQIKYFAIKQKIKLDFEDLRQKKTKPVLKVPLHHHRECPEIVTHKLIEKRYSESTIRTYTHMLSQFFTYFYAYKPQEITHEQISQYIRYLIQERQVSESTQNQAINAIKFYYEKVMGGVRQTYYLERPKKSKYLPTVLSQQELISLLKATKNLKHKAILTTIYSCGIRISELLNMKLEDIDYDAFRIHIKGAKGKKDRYVPLAQTAKKVLLIYLQKINPEEYVFEGINGGKYSAGSIQKLIKRSAKAANITKTVTPHTLRHSFATHLLEKGTDLRYIQHILGHSNSTTTEIYTHITQIGINKIINPLDDFDFS